MFYAAMERLDFKLIRLRIAICNPFTFLKLFQIKRKKGRDLQTDERSKDPCLYWTAS